MPGLSAKQRATILQKRCAISIATSGEESDPESFGQKGVIHVGPVERCGEDFCFVITEEETAHVRGRPRHQTIWACVVVVTEDGDVDVFEGRGLEERIPPGVTECVTEAISESERGLAE